MFSIPQSPSPSSGGLTSPSGGPHTSPSTDPYNGGRSLAHSPPPIDIRAQFLADLRRLRPSSPIEAVGDTGTDYSSTATVGHVDSLPPRKRKVSADLSAENAGKMAAMAAADKMAVDLNGRHEPGESAQVN